MSAVRQDDLRRRAALIDIDEGVGTIIKGTDFRPSLATDLPACQKLDRHGEIIIAVAIGTEKSDFLKGDAARIKARLAILQPDMDNDAAGTRHRRGGSARCPHADSINDKIDRPVLWPALARIIGLAKPEPFQHVAPQRLVSAMRGGA